ncbi:basal body-orientation factor 1-like [Corticium candelabrum]|uniref:basal body-orientation factor 1-like n=1 Tax=Corticium candelabrum TaxID=121492 RepID=UPI002E26D9C2|nr:basal body-orientation factor 1-like [Corticium candelabrum]
MAAPSSTSTVLLPSRKKRSDVSDTDRNKLEGTKSVLDKLLEGNKLSIAFDDYQQWARRPRSRVVNAKQAKASKTVPEYLPTVGTFQFPRPGGARSVGSSLGRRQVAQRPATVAPAETRVLKALITARRRTIAAYNQHQKDLIKRNVALKQQITDSEMKIHDDVDDLLQHYSTFKGAVAVIEKTFQEKLAIEKKALEEISSAKRYELQHLEEVAKTQEKKVKKRQEELLFYKSYKDKVFPEKARRIAELRQNLEAVNSVLEASLDELKSTVDGERQKMEQKEESRKTRIQQLAAEAAIDCMGPVTQSQAIHNMIMKKEIAAHKTALEQLRCDIKLLEAENKLLRQEVSLTRFPNQRPQQKCLPTTELKLDIPQQEWLPV